MKYLLLCLSLVAIPFSVGCESEGATVVAEPSDYEAYMTPPGAAEEAIKGSKEATTGR